MTRNPDQYALDFTSAANERCALLAGLREAMLPIDITPGRVEGVIELLQRLVLFAPHLPTSLSSDIVVDAQVIYLATRIERRHSVQDRTIRRWVEDARELGLLSVRINSHLRGGSKWNTYTVHFATVLELIQTGRTRADTGGHNVRPIGRTQCPPHRADTMSAPLNVLTKESTNHSPAAAPSEATTPPDDCEREKVVVSAFLKMGMTDAARGVRRALVRGLSFADIDQLTTQYRALLQTDTSGKVTIAWLYRWLTGDSRPDQPRAPAPPPRKIKSVIDRDKFASERAVAKAIADTEESLSDQLKRLRAGANKTK